jgi:hypothetical protein
MTLALWAGKTVEGKVEIHNYAVQIKDARSTPFMLIYEGYATFHEYTWPCIYKVLDALSGVY